jgi:hypothetical protein
MGRKYAYHLSDKGIVYRTKNFCLAIQNPQNYNMEEPPKHYVK